MKKQSVFAFLAALSVSSMVLADENSPPCPERLPTAFANELRKSHGHEFALGGYIYKLAPPSLWKNVEKVYLQHSDEFLKEINLKESDNRGCFYEVKAKSSSPRGAFGFWLSVETPKSRDE